MEHNVEYVEWVDAVASSGWEDRSHDYPLHKCFSVGSLVYEDEERIVLAGTWSSQDDADHVNCVISIPIAWIKKRGTLTVWK